MWCHAFTLPAAPQFTGVFHFFIDVYGIVSFGGSEEDVTADDSISITASDAEDWACPDDDPDLLSSSQPTRPSMDILTKAVKDLSLAWSALEEPAKATWRGAVNAPLARGCPVFPRAPQWTNYLAFVVAAEEKGYRKLPSLETWLQLICYIHLSSSIWP